MITIYYPHYYLKHKNYVHFTLSHTQWMQITTPNVYPNVPYFVGPYSYKYYKVVWDNIVIFYFCSYKKKCTQPNITVVWR